MSWQQLSIHDFCIYTRLEYTLFEHLRLKDKNVDTLESSSQRFYELWEGTKAFSIDFLGFTNSSQKKLELDR